jgi:hypothetical protein
VVVEAVAILESVEVAERVENTPEVLLSVLKSFSRVVTWPSTVVRSLPWLFSVACCAFHCVSGARAAVTAAFTAAVTSIPSELEPVATSNSELKSIPLEDVDDELEPSNEAKLDEDSPTELIVKPP